SVNINMKSICSHYNLYLFCVYVEIGSKFELSGQEEENVKIFQQDDAAHVISCAATLPSGISTYDRVLL
ncbi:hypothetical protein, partial [Brucella intermedia]|uniref:hypothetical protein n=1 Tax=Brucella intermedia TaxID=94625 RepID=UPI00224ABBEE